MSTVHDWHPPRTTHRFTGYTPDGTKVAGLVVHAVTHTPFPTTEDDRTASGVNRVSATILGIPKLGFVRAPYKKAPSKPGKKGDKRGEREPSAAKPLLELGEHTQTGEPLSVRIYSFFKANSNYDRGERDEGSASELRVGQVLTFALTEYTFGGDGKDKEVFPPGTTGVLPPATVVELVLNPSHNQSNGYGVKLSRARPLPHTLYWGRARSRPCHAGAAPSPS